MALDTYANLQTSIASWAWRTGDPEFTAQIPDFITLAESRFNRSLRLREMEALATLTLVNSAASLPSDYLEFRRVVASTSPAQPLELVTPDYAATAYPTNYSGFPQHFTIVGSTLTVYPSTSATVALAYYQKIPALTTNNQTNWLLTKAPEVYLYGALVEAAPYMMDDARMATWGQMLQKAMGDLQASDTSARYSRATVRVSQETP